MTERSKETTQTIIPAEPAPDEQRPSTRKPSGKEPSSKEKHWEQKTLGPALEKNPEREQEFTTVSGYPIRRLYTPADLSAWDADRDLGFPGQPPYTRGIHSTMYRGRLWTMRQLAGFGAAADPNRR